MRWSRRKCWLSIPKIKSIRRKENIETLINSSFKLKNRQTFKLKKKKNEIFSQIEKIEARIRNAEKSMNDLKADQKSSIEIFQNYMAKESVAVEYIQKQRESLESKVCVSTYVCCK